MENQHQKIKGYRDLTQAEIDLMNKIKEHGAATEKLIAEVSNHLSEQSVSAVNAERDGDDTQIGRIDYAEPRRWMSMARTDLQVGIMKLTRAVAQPTTF